VGNGTIERSSGGRRMGPSQAASWHSG